MATKRDVKARENVAAAGELHQTVARALVLYYGLVGVWGVFLAIRKSPLSAGYRGALVIGVWLFVGWALW